MTRENSYDDDGRDADDRLTQLDAFHALLPALAGALDIRDVFQQLSAVASRIVPHDEANLALATDDGHSTVFTPARAKARRSSCAVRITASCGSR